MNTTKGDHAVVVGASIAGLLAAHVLADAHEHVTIVERDRLPTLGEGRQAVPQGRHVHLLLPADRLLRVARHDATVATVFRGVVGMLQSPTHLLRPDVVMRVLRG